MITFESRLGLYCAGALALFGVLAPAASLDAAQIDKAVRSELVRLDVPSASVAIVVDGRIAYVNAFGKAQLQPNRPATAKQRYAIASVSKQFLATALLLLQEDGKLSLNDKVGKFLPGLGAASGVTLRQLLSHTAGIRDYWPQDYVFARMRNSITHAQFIDEWVRKPLDFRPGERWQYSNTGYVLAGLIVEKVSGQSVFAFLQKRIFTPLHMTSVIDYDSDGMKPSDAVGYSRFARGPLRPAIRGGKGWLYAAGELAMTAEDLARWDQSIIAQSLMRPASYRELETEVPLSNGVGSRYALGLSVKMASDRRVLAHDGEAPGFLSQNVIYPDQRAAIVVLTNTDAADVGSIADKIAKIVLDAATPLDVAREAEARRVFEDLRRGRIDRTLLSPNANDYFTAQALKDISGSIAPLGAVKSFKRTRTGTRGGMDVRVYEIELAKGDLELITRSLPDGKLEQYMLLAK